MIVGLLSLLVGVVALGAPEVVKDLVEVAAGFAGASWQISAAAVFVVAFIEALFMIGLVAPGSFALVILVAAGIQAGVSGLLTWTAGVLGISAGYAVNMFLLARSSTFRRHAALSGVHAMIGRRGEVFAALISPAVPSFGGVVAFAFGLDEPGLIRKYLWLVSGTAIWVTLVYGVLTMAGPAFLELIRESPQFFGIVAIGYGLLELGRNLVGQRKTK